MYNDYIRVASVTPEVYLADPAANACSIVEALRAAADAGACVAVCPELCITGYTCGDLFHDSTLLDATERALKYILEHSAGLPALCVVGLPVRLDGVLYNCAAAIGAGRLLGIVPKTYLPSYNEFYERRWFAAAFGDIRPVSVAGHNVPMGTGMLFKVNDVPVGIEICEDLWAPVPPSSMLTLGGAEVMLNLSASPDAIGKYDYLTGLLKGHSASTLCGYVYSAAGTGESSTDLVFSGKNIICEKGTILASSERLHRGASMAVADIDLAAIRHDRMHNTTFGACQRRNITSQLHIINVTAETSNATDSQLMRFVDPHPFVPDSKSDLRERCREVIDIQALGLCRRLQATKSSRLVIGISGGLDSTLALLVACRAFDLMKLPRKGIIGVTMPGFGTTGRTRNNAHALMNALGTEVREISIAAAVTQHFSDIGHDPEVHDVTYENSQARERTQILMDIANQTGALVLGTGDLSELALGWATYNGDQMSMYGVNSGVPKTLVRHLVLYIASEMPEGPGRDALNDIVATPISPELIPADSKGDIAQITEDLVGPYELHDFFLFYAIRYGFSPRRIYLLARNAFNGSYDNDTIKKWLRTFFRRFFAQQFKRSCMPDGPKVGSITLSPRGDWRMPSDALSDLWLKECDDL